jgi:SAM-dependent methyltransferase
MHTTALILGSLFFERYGARARRSGRLSILDIGSMDVNGSLREVAPFESHYWGVDNMGGKGVDQVVLPGARLPFAAQTYDLVVSTSALEHDPLFWQTVSEAFRVTADGGFVFINVPSRGPYHRHPGDCWRFYPDSGLALARWGRLQNYAVSLVESFSWMEDEGGWVDMVMIFEVGGRHSRLPPRLSDDPRATFVRSDLAGEDSGHG